MPWRTTPSLAATVELVLSGETGILKMPRQPTDRSSDGPLPARLPPESIEGADPRAVEFGPMIRRNSRRFDRRRCPPLDRSCHLLAAEIGCCAIKLILLGELLPPSC